MKTIKTVLLAAAAVLFLCSFGGCGNVTADPAVDTSAEGGSGGPDGGQAAPGTGGTRATGGSPGTGGNAALGAGGASGGASGTDGADAGNGSIACPPSVPLASCPAGSVLAGDGGTCPAGTKLVAVVSLCVPGS